MYILEWLGAHVATLIAGLSAIAASVSAWFAWRERRSGAESARAARQHAEASARQAAHIADLAGTAEAHLAEARRLSNATGQLAEIVESFTVTRLRFEWQVKQTPDARAFHGVVQIHNTSAFDVQISKLFLRLADGAEQSVWWWTDDHTSSLPKWLPRGASVSVEFVLSLSYLTNQAPKLVPFPTDQTKWYRDATLVVGTAAGEVHAPVEWERHLREVPPVD